MPLLSRFSSWSFLVPLLSCLGVTQSLDHRLQYVCNVQALFFFTSLLWLIISPNFIFFAFLRSLFGGISGSVQTPLAPIIDSPSLGLSHLVPNLVRSFPFRVQLFVTSIPTQPPLRSTALMILIMKEGYEKSKVAVIDFFFVKSNQTFVDESSGCRVSRPA